MAFACIYVPDFLVQAVVRAEPALRCQAIALISGNPPLWSVIAANPAALESGIQLGMTKSQAAEFRGVQVCHRSESQERAAHVAMLDVAWSISPRVEDTAPDTIVLDLEGLASLLGTDENIANELARRVSSIGLNPHIAVASQIEAAILAARGFPGITVIPAGEERSKLSGLPVDVLPASAEVLEILEHWGVDTLQALAALPVLQLSERLGQEGVRLHELACGARQRSLVLAQLFSRFEEELELDDAVEELEPLSFVLGRLLDQLCARLDLRALAARTIHVSFELEPSFEKDFQVMKEDSRKKASAKRYVKTLTLPVPLRNSKTLLKLLRLQLQADPPSAPIQKIRMAADPAAPRVAQNGLFVPRAPDPEKLELTIARLAKLVGETNVGFPELLDTHRPDNFRMTRFSGSIETSRKRVGNESLQGLKPNERASRTWGLKSPPPKETPPKEKANPLSGFRVLRPALPVSVEMREEQPTRVCLRGEYGKVIAISGPWRSSGDWWQEDAWHQDEWDLAVEFSPRRGQSKNAAPQGGVYRIYYDALRQGWFARGLYD
jgi:protein ImuB